MYTRRQKTTRKENKLKHGNEICTVARVCGVHERTKDRGKKGGGGGGGGRGETEPTVIPPPA